MANSWKQILQDSVTYQALLEEGREEGREEGEHLGRSREACRILLRQGTRRFGAPTAIVEKALEAKSLEQLEELTLRLLDVESWQELLAE